jgi:hypothetical protein
MLLYGPVSKLYSLIIRMVALAIAISAGPIYAQIPSWCVDTFRAPADPRWRVISTQDVQAAYGLLRNNHPGTAPELHDLNFQDKLNRAHALALRRANTVTIHRSDRCRPSLQSGG